MQPILQSSLSLNPRIAARRAGMINYAEPASGDELDAEADSDNDSELASGKAPGRTSSFRARGSGYNTPQGTSSPSLGGQHSLLQALGKQDPNQSYLGLIPPTKLLQTKPATLTRHEH
jgi:chromatin structure-remodeling complex subunit SFH1